MSSQAEEFGRIYDEYVGKIYRFAYLKVSDREAAQDITSKVFAKGWQAYQKEGHSIQNIKAFLYQIARNLVVDAYRERDRATFASLDTSKEVMASLNMHENAVFQDDLRVVKNALQNLKQDHQDVLIFHYLDDMSVKEVAEVMDKTPGAVRVMLHRGLQSLKEELQIEEG